MFAYLCAHNSFYLDIFNSKKRLTVTLNIQIKFFCCTKTKNSGNEDTLTWILDKYSHWHSKDNRRQIIVYILNSRNYLLSFSRPLSVGLLAYPYDSMNNCWKKRNKWQQAPMLICARVYVCLCARARTNHITELNDLL